MVLKIRAVLTIGQLQQNKKGQDDGKARHTRNDRASGRR